MIQVTYNGQQFGEVGQAFDGDGVSWAVTEVVGWDHGATRHVDRMDRGGRGTTVTRTRYGGLDVGLRGILRATTDVAFTKARERLPQVFDLTAATFIFHESTPKQAEMRCLDLSVAKSGVQLTFDADLFAPDGRRYSTTETVKTSTIASGSTQNTQSSLNAGTVETHPVVTITGPAVNPRLANMTTLDELELQVTLASGDTLVVDLYEQSVTLNGAAADNLVSGGEWPTLGAGTHSLRYRVTSTSGASSTATWRYRSAWL